MEQGFQILFNLIKQSLQLCSGELRVSRNQGFDHRLIGRNLDPLFPIEQSLEMALHQVPAGCAELLFGQRGFGSVRTGSKQNGQRLADFVELFGILLAMSGIDRLDGRLVAVGDLEQGRYPRVRSCFFLHRQNRIHFRDCLGPVGRLHRLG